ncbi:MAG TPA: phosphatase PAP2 family protein [Thermomicrobiales bacterium]|nr:phosphatase PAP2 family protein [Thermomicrobiales bacterium]
MDDREQTVTGRTSLGASRDVLQHRLTRRGLLRGAVGLGGGALALSATPGVLAGAGYAAPLRTVNQYGPEVALEWFQLMLDIVLTTPRFSPAVANRIFAYLGVTLYEAIVPGIPDGKSLAGRLNELTRVPGPRDHAYHWPTCANSALAQGMRDMFRTTTDANKAAINDLESSIAADLSHGVPFGITKRSVRRGRTVADHIMAWAATDAANSPTEAYVPPVGPGLWVPTPPAFAGPVDPYGGTLRPIAVGPIENYDSGPPPAFSTDPQSEFYAGEMEVYNTVNNLTDEQRTIALYWSRTAGHNISIAMRAVEQSGCNLGTAALALASSAIGSHDGGIAVFYSKYTYNLLRPITYIREYIDPSWGDPLPLTTPPHPDFPAAHATVMRAFAQGLYDVLGNFAFTDRTWVNVGLAPRSWNSWFEMAEETAISRLYGGIHSRWAIEAGLEQGRRVGEAVTAVLD